LLRNGQGEDRKENNTRRTKKQQRRRRKEKIWAGAMAIKGKA